MVDWFSKRPDHAPRPTRNGRRPSVTVISDELLVGEYPGRADIGWLKDTYGITAVHNLQDDDDLRMNGLDNRGLSAEYVAHGIGYVRTPIQDGSADAMAERLEVALHDLHDLVGSGSRVYLHCNAGMNRAPTLAIAFLRAYRQMSLEDAMQLVTTSRTNDLTSSGAAGSLSRAFPRQKFLTACAWGVHLYTALGAALGLLAIFFASRGDFRASFLAMGAATIIDCSDGPLARWLMVKIRVPTFDGALLDNIVDYLTYTVAPVFLMLEAGIIPDSRWGLALACFVMLASVYGFCHTEAKTPDHYFLGFPNYWNLVAFYLS